MDFLLACVSFCLASLVRFQMDIDAAARWIGPILPRAAVFAGLVMIGLLAMGLYRARQRPRTWETVARVMIGVAIAGVCYILVFYFVPYLSSGRGVLAGALVISSGLVSAGRIALLRFVDRNPVKTRIMVLGTGPSALKIGRLRRASDRRRFEVVGYAAPAEADRKSAQQNTELRPLIPIERVAEYPGVDEVVVALDERRGALPVDTLLQLKGRGIPVIDNIEFLERETGKIDLDLVSPSWFVYTKAGYTDAWFRGAKRLVDILLSTVVFVVTAPIFTGVVLLMWLDEGLRAPILYRQSRVGRGGKTFELLKFRSMRVNAEATTGPQWCVQNDDRVTRVGRFIRRFRIDELPQLFNVMRGEMSIVGPRPERPEFVELLTEEVPMFNLRHNMRPGLTGWAQLNFPYGASVLDAREKLSYDIFYIKNASLILDLLIFLQTIEVVVWGRAVSMAGPPPGSEAQREANAERRHPGGAPHVPLNQPVTRAAASVAED